MSSKSRPKTDKSRTDSAVLEYLDARELDILEFARALIAMPSVNPPGDERGVAELVRRRLVELGAGDVTVVGPKGRPNVLASVRSRDPGRRLILSGHLDTKPPGDIAAWDTDPWAAEIRDGQLFGLGSCDMKAAVAGMVYAIGALRHVAPHSGELVGIFTSDEEAGSQNGAEWLAERGLIQGDAAILGEPSGITTEWEAIHLVSRGAALFRIRVRGTQMHSSVSDRFKPVNATVMMARLIDLMDRELRDWITYGGHPLGGLGPTINVGMTAEAGVFYGVYPGNAEFRCDIRTLPGMSRAQLEADIRRFLAYAATREPNLDASLEIDVWVDATEVQREEPIVLDLLEAATKVLGFTPRLDAFPGATDAPHFQLTSGVPTVPSVGPGLLPKAHGPNESLGVSGALNAARVYALAATRFLGVGRPG